MRSLGPGKFCLLYQIFCYISCQQTIQNKDYFTWTRESGVLYQIFCYIRSLYTVETWYKKTWKITCYNKIPNMRNNFVRSQVNWLFCFVLFFYYWYNKNIWYNQQNFPVPRTSLYQVSTGLIYHTKFPKFRGPCYKEFLLHCILYILLYILFQSSFIFIRHFWWWDNIIFNDRKFMFQIWM